MCLACDVAQASSPASSSGVPPREGIRTRGENACATLNSYAPPLAAEKHLEGEWRRGQGRGDLSFHTTAPSIGRRVLQTCTARPKDSKRSRMGNTNPSNALHPWAMNLKIVVPSVRVM